MKNEKGLFEFSGARPGLPAQYIRTSQYSIDRYMAISAGPSCPVRPLERIPGPALPGIICPGPVRQGPNKRKKRG
jgi:hypothetical protein